MQPFYTRKESTHEIMAISDGFGGGSFAVYGPAGTGSAGMGQPKARRGCTHMAARPGLG